MFIFLIVGVKTVIMLVSVLKLRRRIGTNIKTVNTQLMSPVVTVLIASCDNRQRAENNKPISLPQT